MRNHAWLAVLKIDAEPTPHFLDPFALHLTVRTPGEPPRSTRRTHVGHMNALWTEFTGQCLRQAAKAKLAEAKAAAARAAPNAGRRARQDDRSGPHSNHAGQHRAGHVMKAPRDSRPPNVLELDRRRVPRRLDQQAVRIMHDNANILEVRARRRQPPSASLHRKRTEHRRLLPLQSRAHPRGRPDRFGEPQYVEPGRLRRPATTYWGSPEAIGRRRIWLGSSVEAEAPMFRWFAM